MTIFVVSDTHFGHANILKFTQADGSKLRNFESLEAMDEHMVERWNSIVEPSDIVYHLGDVYFGQGYKHLYRLKGKKRLILGNHDDPKNEHIQNNFQKILMWRVFREHNCVLTHVPIHKSSLFKVKYNLHGHVHRNNVPDTDYVNCCVEALSYTPWPIDVVIPKG